MVVKGIFSTMGGFICSNHQGVRGCPWEVVIQQMMVDVPDGGCPRSRLHTKVCSVNRQISPL